jgi:hypothetical protein
MGNSSWEIAMTLRPQDFGGLFSNAGLGQGLVVITQKTKPYKFAAVLKCSKKHRPMPGLERELKSWQHVATGLRKALRASNDFSAKTRFANLLLQAQEMHSAIVTKAEAQKCHCGRVVRLD